MPESTPAVMANTSSALSAYCSIWSRSSAGSRRLPMRVTSPGSGLRASRKLKTSQAQNKAPTITPISTRVPKIVLNTAPCPSDWNHR